MLEKKFNTGSNEELVSISQQKSSCLLCPCPQLTAYWTPPPSCPRRICCCENTSKMQVFSMFRDGRNSCMFVLGTIVTYYLIMDIIFFMRFNSVDIIKDSKAAEAGEIYSPFTHLSIKAIMNDQTSQYIVNPSAEYFNVITRFSSVFYFITPNMLSITHLILAFVAGKFIASDNLHDRRVGVVIFQVRVWLDAFDGVVFRAQSGKQLQYQSFRTSLGYFVDMASDALGGAFLCFGLLFYVFKRFDSSKDLPTFLSQDVTSKSSLPTNGHSSSYRETYSKKYLFWKVFCFGIGLACAGKFWDLAVEDFESVFQVPMKDPKLSMLQYEMCHSTTTIIIVYLWRLVEAQALLQYVLVPIVIDKIWEFLNYTQYILLVIIVCLYLATVIYVHHVRTVLNL